MSMTVGTKPAGFPENGSTGAGVTIDLSKPTEAEPLIVVTKTAVKVIASSCARAHCGETAGLIADVSGPLIDKSTDKSFSLSSYIFGPGSDAPKK